jgi:hypothetical protein
MFGLGWREDSPLDFVQTVGLIVITGVLIYAVAMLRRAIKAALVVLMRDNERMNKQVSAACERIEALEARVAAAEAEKADR